VTQSESKADALFWCNKDGFDVQIRIMKGQHFWLRFSFRNAWVGIRYADFWPLARERFITVQLAPFIAIQFAWRRKDKVNRDR